MDFVTLGMLIIDDIFYPVPRLPALNVLGGAGSYAVLGARLICGAERAGSIGWTVHEGSDFPEAVKNQIDGWNTSCLFVKTPHRLTTRALNTYRENEVRDFEFTTPKIRIDESTLTQDQLKAQSFHFACSPTRCMSLIRGILAKQLEIRSLNELSVEFPVFVWEPIPGLCLPSELNNFFEAIKHVDVASPNLDELGALFDVSFSAKGSVEMRSLLEVCESILFKHRESRPQCIVVRMGHWGCLVADKHGCVIIEPYHPHLNDGAETPMEKVVDPTGAGNAFLGGFCVGLKIPAMAHVSPVDSVVNSQLLTATICGTVAASFAVEQVGMPVLSSNTIQEAQELWNNDLVWKRVQNVAQTKVRKVQTNKTWGLIE